MLNKSCDEFWIKKRKKKIRCFICYFSRIFGTILVNYTIFNSVLRSCLWSCINMPILSLCYGVMDKNQGILWNQQVFIYYRIQKLFHQCINFNVNVQSLLQIIMLSVPCNFSKWTPFSRILCVIINWLLITLLKIW